MLLGNINTQPWILTSEVRQLVLAILTGGSSPDFAERAPAARKVVIACVSGLDMMNAESDLDKGVSKQCT